MSNRYSDRSTTMRRLGRPTLVALVGSTTGAVVGAGAGAYVGNRIGRNLDRDRYEGGH